MQVAERTITDDLEYLIQQSVDPTKADYAVVTGVQIHNWWAMTAFQIPQHICRPAFSWLQQIRADAFHHSQALTTELTEKVSFSQGGALRR